MNTKRSNTKGAVLLCALALIPVISSAQTLWTDRTWNRSVSVEILKPNFKEAEGLKSSSGALFLTLRLPATDQTRVVFELPVAHVAYEWEDYYWDGNQYRFTTDDKSETAIGNPYIGFEVKGTGNNTFEIGLRLPVGTEKKGTARLVGMYSDFDRFEAFSVDVLPIQASFNYQSQEKSGFTFRLRVGPDLWFYTDTDEGDDKMDILFHYGAQAGFSGETVYFLAGVTGRYMLTEEGLDFGERTFHQVGLEAGLKLKKFRPGIHIRFPLDKDLSDMLDNVIGFNCSIGF